MKTFIINLKQHTQRKTHMKTLCDSTGFDYEFVDAIYGSFEKVYHKLSPGAAVLVHDYGWDVLPGVKRACDDFLKDKPEKVRVLSDQLGLLIKE